MSATRTGEIGYYVVEDGVSRKVKILAKFPGKFAKLTIGDLNADGSMDILYSGGVFAKPDVTRMYVMYGKIRNRGSKAPLRSHR